MKRVSKLFFLIPVVLALVACEKTGLNDYPSSYVSYQEFVQEVGCGNPHTTERAKDIFNTKYRDHMVTWAGNVLEPKSDSVLLDMNGHSFSSKKHVRLKFLEKGAGYYLKKDDLITVKFLIKHRGGCVLPVRGIYAQIIK